MHILDQEAPGLADRLRSLDSQVSREILVRACIFASETLGEPEARVHSLLNDLRNNKMLTSLQAVEAASLAEAADSKYFALQREGASVEEWSKWFSLARLLTAISISFREMPHCDAADAVYELCHTQDDASALINLIQSDVEAAESNRA